MAISLRGISTVVPATVLVQDAVRDVFAAQPGLNRLAQRIVTTSFNVSGIERRHSVLEELTLEPRDEAPVFFDQKTGELLLPGTKARNEIYAREATRLYVEAGRAAIEATPGVEASDVTHVITVSCTGFYAPGPDFMVARDLGLNAGVERYHLGFMGCYASIPALRLARQLCEADAAAVVLVISVELCTLHLRSSNDPDTIVASSLFSDGAGSGIVSTRDPEPGERAFELDRFATRITPVGEGDMAWKIGDHGFEMVLSNAVPAIIDAHITGALEPLFAPDAALAEALANDTSSEAIEHWAIHPGGRSILDKVEARLALTEEQLVPARETLRDYGNMSSATVLFVLANILESDAAAGDRVAAMAFGPGLTVESALLTVRG
ncbi:Predicted naringenin-chalcone synthase [Agromyces sp. CF514]|uniref:type III polyketide synthase n=1 Tax=Agromyces sp. CF514 TaxID=1881031 RepID=UPI0008F3E859|nr:type III polyketide synthase [Agromyces sp. CF514]SFR66381.1 Predicted naringenin-chalcone synthase [Agromyces sp. CF514]